MKGEEGTSRAYGSQFGCPSSPELTQSLTAVGVLARTRLVILTAAPEKDSQGLPLKSLSSEQQDLRAGSRPGSCPVVPLMDALRPFPALSGDNLIAITKLKSQERRRQLGPEDKQVVGRWFTVQMVRPGEAIGQNPKSPNSSYASAAAGWRGEEVGGNGSLPLETEFP